jgi:hypothetical protein
MKRILLSITSAAITLFTLFTGLFVVTFIGISAVVLGKVIERKMTKGSFEHRRSAVIEGDYDDITNN